MGNIKGFTLIELTIVVAIIGILSAIAIPQYQIYVVKAQTGRIIGEVSELRLSVEDCLNNGTSTIGTGTNQCDPRATSSNLIQGSSQVGVVLPNNTGVAQMANPLTADAAITATVSNQLNPVIQGKKIIWYRSEDGTWACKTNIAEKYLPSSCNYDNTVS